MGGASQALTSGAGRFLPNPASSKREEMIHEHLILGAALFQTRLVVLAAFSFWPVPRTTEDVLASFDFGWLLPSFSVASPIGDRYSSKHWFWVLAAFSRLEFRDQQPLTGYWNMEAECLGSDRSPLICFCTIAAGERGARLR